MLNLLQFQKLGAVVGGLWLLCAPAMGLIIARDDRANLVFRAQDIPTAITRGSYSCFIWLNPEQTHDQRRRVLSITGGVKITLEPGAGVRATLLTTGAEATAPATLIPGRWALIAVSRDRLTGRLEVWAGSDGGPLQRGWFEPPPAVPGLGEADPIEPPPAEPWCLGAFGDQRGVPGAYGLIVIREHAVAHDDVNEVWSSRRLFAPYDHDNRASGGRMTGWFGGMHMIGHAISSSPADGGVGGTLPAVVGGSLNDRNIHILNFPRRPVGPYWTAFVTARPVESVFGFVYGSRLEPPYQGFFERDLPEADLPPAPAPAVMPALRSLATGPDKATRIMVSANSRGVRVAFEPQNYMHGFAAVQERHVSGVMLRSASLRGPWLGFDTGIAPVWSKVDRVDVLDQPRGDFSRFFTVGGGGSIGGGSGVLIRPGGFHRLRCRPVEGTLIRGDAPLVTEAHVLRFPGSSDLLWRPDRGASQSAEGLRIGAVRRVPLDTTRFVHTLTAADRVITDTTIALAGDLTGAIRVGDACFISDGPAADAISIVSDVGIDGAETVITFEHPFGATPAPGSELRFGEWGYRTVWHPWEAIPAGDPDVWRGLELAAGEFEPGAGVFCAAVSAYRPDVPGLILGAAGWGGNGYDHQLDAAFTQAPERWMAMSAADLWIQGFAQQGSTPEAMARYAEVIQRALPQAEIVWAGDTEHGNNTFEQWHRYILTEARALGYGALSLLLDNTPGAFLEQLADGIRADGAHYSAYGNRVLARGWIDQIEIATRCIRVDLDGDGKLTFFDFLEFSALYAAGDLRADFDGDGVLTFFDFLAFQQQMAECTA